MLLHMHFWGPVDRGGMDPNPNGYKDALEAANQDFNIWRRSHKLNVSQRRFTFWNIFKEEYGCYLNSKGFAARVISSWLEDALRRSQNQPPQGMIPDARAYLALTALTLVSITIDYYFCPVCRVSMVYVLYDVFISSSFPA